MNIPNKFESNKPHKFFERHLNNNLEELSSFLEKINLEMSLGNLPGISKEKAQDAEKSWCMATILSPYYNIFQFHNEYIYNLYLALRDMTIEACDYYNIDFKKKKYYLQGWFNFDGVSDDMGDMDLHDHAGDFHGYYCVNAEPSVTHYKINGEQVFDNINKNNRAILSQTGHPHRKGGWDSNQYRITIAYDMMPITHQNKESLEQHWIPLG